MPEPTPQFVDAPGPIFVDAQGPKFVDAPGPTPLENIQRVDQSKSILTKIGAQAKELGAKFKRVGQEFKEIPGEASGNFGVEALDKFSYLTNKLLPGMIHKVAGVPALLHQAQVAMLSDDQKRELAKEKGFLADAYNWSVKESEDLSHKGTQLLAGESPYLSTGNQAELKRIEETSSGSLGGGVGHAGAALFSFSGAAKLGVIAPKFGVILRGLVRGLQGIVAESPNLVQEFNQTVLKEEGKGATTGDAYKKALLETSKSAGVAAPTFGLMFSDKFNAAFSAKGFLEILLKREAKATILGVGQATLANAVHGRPLDENVLESWATMNLWEGLGGYHEVKTLRRAKTLTSEYPDLPTAIQDKGEIAADATAGLAVAKGEKDTPGIIKQQKRLAEAVQDLAALNHARETKMKFKGPSPQVEGAPNASEVQGPVEVGKLPSGEESAGVEGRQGVGPVEPGTEVTGASEVKVEAPKVEPVSVKLKDGTKNTFEHPEDVAEVQATRDALKEKISQIKEMPMTTKERAAAIKDLVIDHDTAIRNIAEKTKAREAEENPVVPIEDRNNVDRRHLEQAVDVERRAQDRRASRRAEKASEKPIGEMSPEEMRDEITRLRQDRLLDEKIPGMWNRIAFEREYQEGQPVATLDVKGLKEANKHGQVVGDTLLIHVGETLDKAAKGLGGNAAHINGDEYTLLGESAEHLEKIINETNTRLKEKPILIRDEQGEIVDQLVGELHYGTGTSPEASDRAMAAAKARRKQQESLTDVQDQTGRSGLPGGLPEVTSGSEAGTVVAKPVETPDPKAAEQVPVVKPSDTKEIGKAIDEGKPISFVKPSGDPVKDYFEQIRMRPTLMPSEGMTHGVERGVHFALMRQVRGMHIADEVSCSNLLRSAAAEYPLESRIEARKYLDSLDAGTPSDKTKLSPDAQKYIGFHDEIMKQWGDAFKEAKANKALDLGEDWEVNLQRVPRRVVDLEGKGIGNPRGALKTKGSSENARSMVAGVDAEGNRYVMGLDGAKARVYQDGEIVGDARQIELAKEGKPAVYRFGGKDLKIGQATVDELEQHTGLKYLQDPLASTMFSLNDLANVNRTFRVLDGLKKQGIVKKTIVAPDGWVPIELGNFKDMSAPKGVAGVLNGLARQLQPRGKQGEGLGARIAKISRLLVNVGFVQPMVHGPNMLDHGFAGRGLSQWVSRDGYRNLSEEFQSAAAMANDTPTRNMILALDAAANPLGSPLAMKILNAGGRYMNISPERTAMLRVYNDAIMRSAAEHPAYWDDLLGKMGIKGIDKITDIVSTVSDKVWMADNMLRAAQYLEMAKKMHIDMDNPAEFQKAIREVDRAGYVDYDIPNVGKMGKFGDWMQTSPEFLFARYHFGAMRILKNKCVDTLSAANPGAWNSKLGRQRIIKNADKLAGLVVLSTIIYPALDFMVQQIADDKNVEFRRGGTTHLAELFHKTLVTQEKTPGQALSTLVTPAPHLALAVSMFNNFTNPATGQKIIHQSDLWSAKQNLGEGEYREAAKDASRLLTDPLLYSASLVGPVQTGMNAFRDYRGEEEKDITDKTRRFVSYLLGAKHKAENPEDRANRNMVREHKKTVKERNR